MSRRRWQPPEHDPAEQEKARSAIADAVRLLNSVIARQPEVDRAAETQRRISCENHLAPNIASALGAHRD